MRFYKNLLFFELIIISTYFFLILFSIVILPLNIAFGIICILFFPGYNLLNLIKPEFTLLQKLGYSTILSLAIENTLMLLSYIFLYDVVNASSNSGFIFNEILLILTIQIINLVLILMNELIRNKKNIKTQNTKKFDQIRVCINNKENKASCIKFKSIVAKSNIKISFIYIIYFFSLIGLCISSFLSNVPDSPFSVVQEDYRSNFTFYYRVNPLFFIFLSISILCLTYIIFFTKNKYLILTSISIFLYCLWILPYLQIKNYFGQDSYYLKNIYIHYNRNGIICIPKRGFLIGGAMRYSTSIFTSILLTSSTGVNIDFALWYLYPLIFIFSPFFFYSVFQNISNNEYNDKKFLIILTILAISTAQFLKSAHSATTMVLGIYIFFILVIEFYNMINNHILRDKLKIFFLIIFLYFFLCLTHFEECVYFLLLIFFYNFYFLFYKIKKIKKYNNPDKGVFELIFKKQKNQIANSKSIKNSDLINFKETLIILAFLLCISAVIFYLTQEFFGTISYYLYPFKIKNHYIDLIYNFYDNYRVYSFPVMRGFYRFNLLILLMLFPGLLLFLFICNLIFFKFYDSLYKVYSIFSIYFRKIFRYVKVLFSTKGFQLFIIPFFISVILLVDLVYYKFLQEEFLFLIIEISLNYSIMMFHLFLFFKGILYYKIENHKQNFFLLCIIASSSLMILLFTIGNNILVFHILNARFLPTFFFFNLIIIQDTYFKKIMNKKKIYLIIMVISLLFLGTFYSLNKIGWE